ncbi:PREDICTED: B9 domain-containing protein 1 isoform X3 [Miniopterus natalensis]|uniref:B9 domain-containing protein 1 isoform X3 n=1 Tax=Miniopterus natalensis TaxID=291302 RepID=UPI0007A70C61|nr:PREDICTED: B9 domain-containing protein 1 isoform X3 [Miniopterus natalensis]
MFTSMAGAQVLAQVSQVQNYCWLYLPSQHMGLGMSSHKPNLCACFHSFLSTTISTASTALCMAMTGPPRRVWRKGSHRSRLRAKMYGRCWCGTSPSTSPLKAPTHLAGHRLCSASTDQMCSGMTWSGAMGQCTCPSHLAGIRGPSPCLSQSLHLSCKSSQAGSWDGGLSTQTPRSWLRVKAGKAGHRLRVQSSLALPLPQPADAPFCPQ